MLTYKTHTNIDEKGSILLKNLPFKNQREVEVIIFIKEKSKINKDERLAKLSASFGTIKSPVVLPDESVSREYIYEDDGR